MAEDNAGIESLPEGSKTMAESEKCRQRKLQFLIAELEARFNQAKEERSKHLAANIKYPDEEFFSMLDSSFKKNTAFVKKIRNMTEVQKDAILKELGSLNLSRYVSEIAIALVETKFKFADLPLCLKVCSFLHLRYQDFSNFLLDAWIKSFPKKPADAFNSSKIRTDIRFFTELILTGIFASKEAIQTLMNLLALLINNDKESHKNLNIICVFCRYYAPEFLGLFPSDMCKLSVEFPALSLPVCDFISQDRQKTLANHFQDYYRSAQSNINKTQGILKCMDRENQKTLALRGEINKERKAKYDAQNGEYQKLVQFAQQLSELLNQEFIEIEEENISDSEDKGMNIEFGSSFQTDSNLDIWDDNETKNFYECLPDLKSIIPSILYKDSQEEATSTGGSEDISEKEPEFDENKADELFAEENLKDINENDELQIALSAMNLKVEDDNDELCSSKKSCSKLQLNQFFDSLSTRQNRDIIDKAALTFATQFNTRANRKKLVNVLFTVKRTRFDLLAYYARFVAQLDPIMPGVTQELIAILKSNFRYLFKKKDQIIIESKIKCVRFIGELVNFKLYSKADALYLLKTLLTDFKYHHIDMACNFLEVCGKFLFRSPESHASTKQLLDQMARLKNRMAFDSRYVIMIQNVCCIVYPPESRPSTQEVVKPPIQQYIDKMFLQELPNSINIVTKIRRLDWNDDEIRDYTVQLLTSPWCFEYNDLSRYAKFLKNFYSYQPTVVIAVLDGILEDIRINLEMDNFEFNQRRLAVIKLFSECFLNRLFDVNIIFQILYLLITFGINYDDLSQSVMDFSTSLMRIRLVASILKSCGNILQKVSKKPLDFFLLFYQRYFWFKKTYLLSLPLEVIGVNTLFYIDTIFREVQLLKPKFQFAHSYLEAVTKLENALKDVANKTNRILTSDKVTVEQFVYPHREYERKPSVCNLEIINEDAGDDEEDTDNDDDDDDDSEETESNALDSDSASDIEPEEEIPKPTPKKALLMKCSEDDDFMREFDQMMADTWTSRSNEVVNTKSEIVIPIERSEPKKSCPNVDFSRQEYSCGKTISLALDEKPEVPKDTVTFRVISKNVRTNKPVLKSIQVSPDSELVRNYRIREEELKAEKEAFKKVILDMAHRREMDDSSSSMDSPQKPQVQSILRNQSPTNNMQNSGNSSVNYHQYRRRFN